ncbi:MAG: hypothetical protein RR630_01180 [Coprobacillus sp.]
MKKKSLHIALLIVGIITIGVIVYMRNQEPDYTQLGYKYLKIEEKTYLLTSTETLDKVGKNFKDMGLLKETYETTLLDIDNYHYFIDNNQKDIIFIGSNEEYLQLVEGSYIKTEEWALPPIIQINDKLYYQRERIQLDLLPTEYSDGGTIDFYYNRQTQENFSTNNMDILGEKVYINKNNEQYIYTKYNNQYIRWDADNS